MGPTKLEISDIRLEWDWVKKGIEEILADQPQLTFRAEDVYAECLHGEAVLWVTDDSFFVTQHSTDPFNNQNSLIFWLGWTSKKGTNVINKYYPFFNEVAKNAGYTNLVAKTPIHKFGEHLLRNEWELDTVIYRKKVE